MRQIWVGCILLSTAVGGQAATLGRHSGAAVIGRPLDMRVQALLAPGEELSDLCVHTDVFYGDTQVSPSAVRTTPQKTAPDAEASLRVQVSTPVDEPVVTVYVRAGCSAPFSRRYVLLADPVTEPVATPMASGAAAPSQAVLPVQALPSVKSVENAGAPQAGPSEATPPVASSRVGMGEKAVRPKSPSKARQVDASPGKAVSVVKRPASPAKPRLELEPVDMSLPLDKDPVLKMSLSMLSEPAASEEERAAAARLWKAINASPEDILRDNQKLQVLEAEAKGLREQEARDKAALTELQAQVEQSRYMSWLAYGLGAALLAAGAAAIFFWRKRGSGHVAGGDNAAARAWWAAASAEKALESGDASEMVGGRVHPDALDLDLDLDAAHGRKSVLDSMRPMESELDEDSTPAVLSRDRRDFAPSQMPVSRSVATEELFDVQQQADFFISLGENEQAIQILRNHLIDNQEPSPLAYLDLLKLYHMLGRREDYSRLREDFNRTFNAGAPLFEQYSDQSRGLEEYETAFGRIQALWPQPRVLDVIEKSIFREPGDVDAEVFDLEAYRELLLLHAIAKDVIKRDSHDAARDFEHTSIKPLKAADSRALAAETVARAEAGRETQPMNEIPHVSPRLGLDVDLDALSEMSAFEASLPEVPTPVQPTAKPAQAPGVSPDADLGNLIDFEMLDFMPPDEADKPPGKKH